MKSYLRVFLLSLGIFAFTAVSSAPSAHALRTRTKIVRSSGYGLAAGLAAGIISWPISGDSNALWAGAAVGLVLGLGYGLYWAYGQDESLESQMSVRLRGLEKGRDPTRVARAPTAFGAGKRNGAGVVLAAPIYSFSF